MKKIICAFLAALLMFASVPAVLADNSWELEPVPLEINTPDLDHNGVVDTADVVILLRHLNGDVVLNRYVADVNLDGKVSVSDCVALMRHIN